MATIFENSMATGRYAKDASSALCTPDVELEDDGEASALPTNDEENGGASSTTTRANNKRSRHAENDDIEGLVGAFTKAGDRIASALKKVAVGNMDLPPDLLQQLMDLPGFTDTHKSFYYAHLVENLHISRAFYNAPFEYKVNFIAKWVSERFSNNMD